MELGPEDWATVYAWVGLGQWAWNHIWGWGHKSDIQCVGLGWIGPMDQLCTTHLAHGTKKLGTTHVAYSIICACSLNQTVSGPCGCEDNWKC